MTGHVRMVRTCAAIVAGSLLIMPRNTLIAYAAVLRSQWSTRHAINAEGLAIQTALGCKVFDNLQGSMLMSPTLKLF
jgi:hypothetical protein